LQRENGSWQLYVDGTRTADAETIIEQEIAWRLYCKGISKDEALGGATLLGDRALASKALEMISVIG
jgi:hypothetical protein